MYNESLKQEFLSKYVDGTQRNYMFILNKAEKTESLLKKDVYQFNINECDKLIRSYSNRSEASIFSNLTCLRRYVSFCIDKGLVPDKINLFDSFGGTKALEKYLDKTAIEKKYITEEELIEIEELCINEQDAVIPELLFVGIKGEEANELLNLQIENVYPDKIVLPDRVVPIQERTYNLIQAAIKQSKYIKGNGSVSETIKSASMFIQPNSYILRTAGKLKTGGLSYQSLSMRIGRIKSYFDNPYLTINNIWVSGQIHLLKQIKANKGYVEKEDYIEVNKQFGYNNWFLTKQRVERFL